MKSFQTEEPRRSSRSRPADAWNSVGLGASGSPLQPWGNRPETMAFRSFRCFYQLGLPADFLMSIHDPFLGSIVYLPGFMP